MISSKEDLIIVETDAGKSVAADTVNLLGSSNKLHTITYQLNDSLTVGSEHRDLLLAASSPSAGHSRLVSTFLGGSISQSSRSRI